MSENENLPPKSPDSKPDKPPTVTPRPDSDDSILDFGVTASVREGASGVIPLADLPDPQSSPSLVSWTEVIRHHRETAQAPSTGEPIEPVKIDSTSDKDLLARIVQEEQQLPLPSAEAGERDTDKLGSVPMLRGQGGSSVELDRETEGGSLPRSGSAVRFDVSEPTLDTGGVMPSPWADAMIPEALPVDDRDPISGVVPMAEMIPYEAGEDELAFAAEMAGSSASGSGISFEGGSDHDLELVEFPSDDGSPTGKSSILDMLVSDEQLEEAVLGRTASDIVDVTAKPNSDLMADLDSGKKHSKPASGKKKAADETAAEFLTASDHGEESVDLYTEGPVSRGISDSGSLQVSDEEMAEASRRQKMVESSAIDLSSSPSSSMFEVSIEEEAIDMSLPDARDSAAQHSMIRHEQRADVEAQPVRAHRGRKTRGDSPMPAKSRAAAVANEEPDAFDQTPRQPPKSPRSQKPDAAPRKKGGLLLGAFLGILLAAGGIGAAWYFKQIPDPDSVFGDGAAKKDNKANNDAEVAKVRKDAEDATKAAEDLKKAAIDMVAGLTRQLKEAGIEEAKPEDGLKKALADRADAETKAQNAAKALLTADADMKVIRDKVQPKNNQKVSDAVLALFAAKEKAEADQKAAELAVTAVSKQLKDAGIDDPKLEDGLKKAIAAKADAELKLKSAVAALDKAGAKDPDFARAVAMLVAEKDGSDAAVKGIRERLAKAKVVAADADYPAIFKAIDDAITRGSSDAVAKLAAEKKAAEDLATKLNNDLAKTKKETDAVAAKAKEDLAAQKTMYEAKLADVRTPGQLIDVWLPALVDKDKPANTAAALADVDVVMKNAASSDADKAKAMAVKALALRNQGKFTEARAAFDEARKHPGFAKDQAWAKAIALAGDNLANPAAFVGAAQSTVGATQQQLLERVEGGLKLFEGEKFAKDRARLIAQRSLLKLDAADLAGAQADADEAVKTGAGADGHFAKARVFEAQGKFADAETAFRAVLKAQAEGSPLYKQASLGLARVLLQKSQPAAVTPATTSQINSGTLRNHLSLMLVLIADPEGVIPPDVQEALNLADALIVQKEFLGYIIKADALAKIGRFNAALSAYSTGIKALKVLPKEYEGVLDRILAKHPAMQQLEINVEADPSRSLKHYALGLEHYRARQYALAEEQFKTAISHWNKDARYMYFLGLSRWTIGRKEMADADFKAGSLLEMKGLPLPKVITEVLERVQGEPRAAVEAARP
jgi:hypothetical protein